MSPDELIGCLARNERACAYARMKEMTPAEWQECEVSAQRRGFADFNELVSFYTIRDIGDDAPGNEQREKVRKQFQRVLKAYVPTSRATQVIRSASNNKLAFAAFRRSWAQLVLAVLLSVIYCVTGNIVAGVACLIACTWGIARCISSYKTALFMRRSYVLFRKYGVHGLRAEGAD